VFSDAILDESVEKEYLSDLGTFGNGIVRLTEKLHYPQKFMAILEFHCFPTVLRKAFRNNHLRSLPSIFDGVTMPHKWRN
jgi:hypothetical protein